MQILKQSIENFKAPERLDKLIPFVYYWKCLKKRKSTEKVQWLIAKETEKIFKLIHRF